MTLPLLPPRCTATTTDDTTPSGMTRCTLNDGHIGCHVHRNTRRGVMWGVGMATVWDFTPMDAP